MKLHQGSVFLFLFSLCFLLCVLALFNLASSDEFIRETRLVFYENSVHLGLVPTNRKL